MISEEDRISNNENKLNFFMNEGIPVHVDLMTKTFYNGKIIKKAQDGIYIIDDHVLGPQHIFLTEILKVDTFRYPKDKPVFNNS
jgi:hypothetical protein